MTEYPAGRGFRSGDLAPRLRLAALVAVITGVVLLAAAAFLLSYSGIHHIALQAGVTPRLARLYPLIFDAMLVIASAAVLALRGAGWPTRCYVWLCLIALLAAVATGDAVHAMGVALPRQPSRAGVAVTPWALVLLAFGLLLAMLRHLRKIRASGRAQARSQALGGDTGEGLGGRGGHIALLEPRAGEPPALPTAERPPQAPPAAGPPAAAAGYADTGEPHGQHQYQGEEGPGTQGYQPAHDYPTVAGHHITEEYLGTDEYGDTAEYPETDEYHEPPVHAGSGPSFEAWAGHAQPAGTPQDLGADQPGTDDADAGQGGEPGSGQAGTAQPSAGQPGTGQPSTGNAGTGQTGAGQAGPGHDDGDTGGAQPSGEAGNPGEDQSHPGDIAPAPVTQFDRVRSTPTRPEE